jgi:thiosulfate dehydrogenase
VERSPEEQGAEWFESTATSRYPFNAYACSTCHHAGPSTDERIRTGAPLAGMLERPTYWGGAEIDALRAVNHCLSIFMLDDEAWTGIETPALAIHAYLASLPPGPFGTAPAPFSITIPIEDPGPGDSERGAATYQRACATCHGAAHDPQGTGKLVSFAALLPQDVLEDHPLGEYTKEEQRLVIVEKIRHGPFFGYGGIMPPFSTEKLSDADIADILSWLGL